MVQDGLRDIPDGSPPSDVEAVIRAIAAGYGDYPDSARCRIDTLRQGIKYK